MANLDGEVRKVEGEVRNLDGKVRNLDGELPNPGEEVANPCAEVGNRSGDIGEVEVDPANRGVDVARVPLDRQSPRGRSGPHCRGPWIRQAAAGFCAAAVARPGTPGKVITGIMRNVAGRIGRLGYARVTRRAGHRRPCVV